MFKSLTCFSLILGASSVSASDDPLTPKEIELSSIDDGKAIRKSPPVVRASFAPFTGKILGEKVRLRLQPDLDGYIVAELGKNEMVSIVGQEGDFYALEPSELFKAYIFRSFVLDGVVEGNRVNVRLEPDLESPIIGHVNSGDRVEGEVSSTNHKWLEIAPPQGVCFYVSKEFIEHAGGPELKAKVAKRKEMVDELLQAANLYTQSEMNHPFEEIDFEKIKAGYLTIIHDYSDFPKKAELAKTALAEVQENYLQKRIAYLEEKAALASSPQFKEKSSSHSFVQTKMWGPVEQALYASWAAAHENESIDRFYEEEKLTANRISGVLEAFKTSVNNKPGDYVIKRKNLPVAYVYSTVVDLEDYVGKNITLIGSSRPNNHFAFPAYFIHEVE